MENSHIEWTTHTFNPWIGCTKVSPGCAHCYAETLMDTRYGRVKWGKGNPRQRTSESNWRKPRAWNRAAAQDATGVRPRVFCASLADWLDDEVPIEWLADLMRLICETPELDWLLLTKRPQNWRRRMEEAVEWMGSHEHEGFIFADCWLSASVADLPPGDFTPGNVWVGTTVEDQARANERIPQLLAIPAKVRFLSCEPLLERVDLAYSAFNGADSFGTMPGIHWVIAGGESGPGARPMLREWAIDLRDQCQRAGVPFLFKQWGGVNKAKTGRILDGQTYDEIPEAAALKEGK